MGSIDDGPVAGEDPEAAANRCQDDPVLPSNQTMWRRLTLVTCTIPASCGRFFWSLRTKIGNKNSLTSSRPMWRSRRP